jgi:hypothetical protein
MTIRVSDASSGSQSTGRAATGTTSRAKRLTPVTVKPLTWGERLDILDALSQVLDGVYAHLTLKRSL